MDTGEAVVDEEDEECDALFTMDDLADGDAAAKKKHTDEVSRTSSGHEENYIVVGKTESRSNLVSEFASVNVVSCVETVETSYFF